MFLTRGLLLAALVGLVATSDGEGAAPPKKDKGGREMTFKGIITDVNQGKNKKDEAGTITVRGHDEKGGGKGKGKNKGQAGKGGQRETETFRLADRTLVIRMAGQGGPGGKGGKEAGKGGKGKEAGKGKEGGKGGFGGMMLTVRQLREGDLVEVNHAGHLATEVRVLGHLGGPGDGKGKGKAK